MNKKANPSKALRWIGVLVFVTCTSFGLHKFYMGIYQVEYVPAKKRLQISMRLFVDDCNTVLYENHQQKTKLGDAQESAQDVNWLNAYIQAHFKVNINGKSFPLQFKRKEMDNNVLVCYYTCEEVPKLNRVVIENTMFTDVFADQQNMIQSQLFGNKQSALLTQNASQAIFTKNP